MPDVVVAWYNSEDEEAGYHVCSNCEIGKSIPYLDIVVGDKRNIRKDLDLCLNCEKLQRSASSRCNDMVISTVRRRTRKSSTK